MATKDLAARGLDVAARSIDLLTVLGELSNQASPMYQMAIDFARWLEREKLNHWQLQSCLRLARDLVQPNDAGLQFFSMVLSGSRTRAVGPLFTQPHGSLGRYLTKDDHLRWMTSTISCLFEYHSEGFISDTLCAFVMQSNLARGQKPLSEHRLAHHPMRLEVKPVINKVVSSIWCNVVNSLGIEQMSGSVLRLPKELQDICPRGHHLESHTLGLAMSKICDSPAEVIIESEHLLTNLTLWLVLHFHGKLRVVVSGATVYEKYLGDEERRIEIRTKRFCDSNSECKSDSEKPMFKMYTIVGSKFDAHMLSGMYDTQMTIESVPRARQPLYKSPVSYSGSAASLSLKLLTRSAAKKIMAWLLDCKVEKNWGNQLSFRVLHDVNSQGINLTVADVVRKVPLIRNMDWDVMDHAAAVVFMQRKAPTVDEWLDAELSEDEMMGTSGTSEYDEDTPVELLNYFSILHDLYAKVRQSCKCHVCRSSKRKFHLNQGCLQRRVLHEVLFYIAHAIADGFGASDASSRSAAQIEADDMGVSRILLDAVDPTRQEINWHSWLNTASRVVLGCPSLDDLDGASSRDVHYTEKMNFSETKLLTTSTVAVQFGGLAVIAPWLELAAPISRRGCFGMIVVRGQVGVIANGFDGSSHFLAVEAETAVTQTLPTEETSYFVNSFPKKPELPDSDITIPTDHSEVSSDYILVADGQTLYKLLMRVSSGSHSRLIDPSLAMLKLSQGLPTLTCHHAKGPIMRSPPLPRLLKTYAFEDLLGRWSAVSPPASNDEPTDSETVRQAQWDEKGFEVPTPTDHQRYSEEAKPNMPSTYHCSFGLDTYFKYHVALALALDHVAIANHGGSCMNCALESVPKMKALDGIDDPNHDRWVINRTADATRSRPKEAILQAPVSKGIETKSLKRLRYGDSGPESEAQK
ncbi:uncharacterized protein EI97DRAFT_489820 [Westerdykella ornata]|uniref:Uncharacterized protein n=1 Tax=Westerdykella ornata TaxID=318751 RepID=A0A6A6JL41_WESOR|nr:uncharacterized protein EI97DRAFT_489820 [Westerdykella ornata]KAF2277202.1 hypothetical protein EI97DRAFT_489820 [Westerdykella ornata]